MLNNICVMRFFFILGIQKLQHAFSRGSTHGWLTQLWLYYNHKLKQSSHKRYETVAHVHAAKLMPGSHSFLPKTGSLVSINGNVMRRELIGRETKKPVMRSLASASKVSLYTRCHVQLNKNILFPVHSQLMMSPLILVV